jgi:formylglycine-generating enzyme required for sulfatase activity
LKLAGLLLLAWAPLGVQTAEPGSIERDVKSGIDWVKLEGFSISRTETTIGQFRRFVDATASITKAERDGGGSVFEAGWTRKPDWSWAWPYGKQYRASDDEPAAHVTYDEAQAFCRWAGGHLPNDAQWTAAAYREQRSAPPAPFTAGKTYRFPTGDSARGAQCLHDMGANLWEWVDDPPGQSGNAERLTRGGSWWYGSGPMREDHRQSKPGDTAVVYIGFRCAKGVR